MRPGVLIGRASISPARLRQVAGLNPHERWPAGWRVSPAMIPDQDG
jgi:hypothetical protein